MATEHAAGYCCSFRADEAAAFAVRTYARPQQLHSLESESDDMRGDTSLVLHCLYFARCRAHGGGGGMWQHRCMRHAGAMNAAMANAGESALSLREGRLCSTQNFCLSARKGSAVAATMALSLSMPPL